MVTPRQRRAMLTLENTQPRGPMKFLFGVGDRERLAACTSAAEREAVGTDIIAEQLALIEGRARDARADDAALESLPASIVKYIAKCPKATTAREAAALVAEVGEHVTLMKLKKRFKAYVMAGRDAPFDPVEEPPPEPVPQEVEDAIEAWQSRNRRQHQGAQVDGAAAEAGRSDRSGRRQADRREPGTAEGGQHRWPSAALGAAARG